MLMGYQGRTTATGTLSDGDLIERSLADPAWFAAIFDRHCGEILRYAHARLGPDLAEDVVAETFLAAFSRRDRYDTGRADARPWLYGIAVRQIGKHRRAVLLIQGAAIGGPGPRAAADVSELASFPAPAVLAASSLPASCTWSVIATFPLTLEQSQKPTN